MVDPTPKWQFTARRSLTQWYGRVQLLDRHVLGQWFCLDRETGAPLWQRRFCRPNTIHGVARDVIIASEMRSDGPWTGCFGCYGISLLNGRLLWTSHRPGVWGRLVRLFDFIPGFTNDLRDVPAHVVGDRCICESGRVLDVTTGRIIEHIAPERVDDFRPPPSDHERLGETGYRIDAPDKLRIGRDAWLSRRGAGEPAGAVAGKLKLHLFRDDGSLVWRFDLADIGRHAASFHYCPAYGDRPPSAYIVASEEPHTLPHPTRAQWGVPNASRHHLLTLDLVSGLIVQNIAMGDEPLSECRIEDADDTAVLVSRNGSALRCYQRT